MIIASQTCPQDSIATETITRFADFILGYCEGHAAIRMLRESGTEDGPPWSLYPAIDEHLAGVLQTQASRAYADRRGLFIVPCSIREPGNAKAANIYQTCVIPVDLDEGDIDAQRAHLEYHLGAASLVVASGGLAKNGDDKLHLYWKLTETVSGQALGQIADLRKRIAAAVAADASFDRLTQPIRVPGSVHGKNGVYRPVQIVTDTGQEYDLSELLESASILPRLPDLHPKIELIANRSTNGSVADLQTRRIRSGARDGLTRFAAMSSVMGHWIRLARLGKTSLEEALAAVHDHNLTLIDPPWSTERADREFSALLEKDKVANSQAWAKQTLEDGNTTSFEELAPEHSEDSLASAFIQTHGQNLRFVVPWGKWLCWDGKVWLPDERHSVRDLVRRICRAGTLGLKSNEARRIASRKTIAAVEAIAVTDPDVASHPSDWDTAATLLNTPDGIVDLETGELLLHNREALITNMASASPGSSCSRWLAFLEEITGGDQDLIQYLSRVCGYCLTGETNEQVFFFLYGSGANGKSVFVRTISCILGSYAATAPLETFMASRNASHPTDLAGLRGKRLITVSETEPGRAWAESRIKTITGGDPIRARFMHRDFFEFTPTFKLMFVGNHRPQLSGISEAMRRRLHLIPFTITIPSERRDPHLSSTLDEELNGIFGWMIQGLADWRRIGLSPPSSVLDASDAYFQDEDLVGQWIAECCLTEAQQRASSKGLFASWSSWAESVGSEKGSQKTLGEDLRGRGFEPSRTSRGRFWKGIGLRAGNPGCAE